MEEKIMPLSGVKVVELATVVAAPTTARMLCAYGAEVIKVEALDGDVMRVAGTHEMTPYADDLNPIFTIHNSSNSASFRTNGTNDVLNHFLSPPRKFCLI